MNRKLAFALAVAAALAGSPALAKDKQPAPAPEVFQAVVECRAITEPAARLACYDAKVATLAEAQTTNELFVASKDDLKKARRGLFGLSLPKISLFGIGDDDDDDDEGDSVQIKEIDAVVQNASMGRQGWVFTLDDGATWIQTDGIYINTPRPGAKIHIRRAALGSYMARVNDGIGIRVRRENR